MPHTPPHDHIVPPLAPRSRIAMPEDEMVRWGEELGRRSEPPLLIAISGDLGSGKTTLVQAICRGYGVREEVTSPTFALVHEYAADRSPVYHLDLYRLKGAEELTNIGWDDIVSARALVLVEWGERAGERMPADYLHLELEHIPGDPDRRILLAG